MAEGKTDVPPNASPNQLTAKRPMLDKEKAKSSPSTIREKLREKIGFGIDILVTNMIIATTAGSISSPSLPNFKAPSNNETHEEMEEKSFSQRIEDLYGIRLIDQGKAVEFEGSKKESSGWSKNRLEILDKVLANLPSHFYAPSSPTEQKTRIIVSLYSKDPSLLDQIYQNFSEGDEVLYSAIAIPGESWGTYTFTSYMPPYGSKPRRDEFKTIPPGSMIEEFTYVDQYPYSKIIPEKIGEQLEEKSGRQYKLEIGIATMSNPLVGHAGEFHSSTYSSSRSEIKDKGIEVTGIEEGGGDKILIGDTYTGFKGGLLLETFVHELTHRVFSVNEDVFSGKIYNILEVKNEEEFQKLVRSKTKRIWFLAPRVLSIFLGDRSAPTDIQKVIYGGTNSDEFNSVMSMYYTQGKRGFLEVYTPLFGKEKAQKLYDYMKDDIFRGKEYGN